MTKTEQTQYDAAVARKILNARYQAALALAEVAETICRNVGTSAESLAGMTDAGWMKLSRLAGRNRKPSAETRSMVIEMVATRLSVVAAA